MSCSVDDFFRRRSLLLRCLFDFIWELITLLLRLNSSRHAIQNNFLFETHKFCSGKSFTLCKGVTDFGSNVPWPLDLLLPLGGGFSCILRFLEISESFSGTPQTRQNIFRFRGTGRYSGLSGACPINVT